MTARRHCVEEDLLFESQQRAFRRLAAVRWLAWLFKLKTPKVTVVGRIHKFGEP